MIPNAKPPHIASLYASSWTDSGAFVPDLFTVTPSARDSFVSVALKMIVVIARPNELPSWDEQLTNGDREYTRGCTYLCHSLEQCACDTLLVR